MDSSIHVTTAVIGAQLHSKHRVPNFVIFEVACYASTPAADLKVYYWIGYRIEGAGELIGRKVSHSVNEE